MVKKHSKYYKFFSTYNIVAKYVTGVYEMCVKNLRIYYIKSYPINTTIQLGRGEADKSSCHDIKVAWKKYNLEQGLVQDIFIVPHTQWKGALKNLVIFQKLIQPIKMVIFINMSKKTL